MPRNGPKALLGLALLQALMMVAVPAQVARPAALSPLDKPAPEGWSLLVDRISDSRYGLMDPIEPPQEAPVEPQKPVRFYTEFKEFPEQPDEWAPATLETPPTQVRQIIQMQSLNQGVDPLLIESIVRNESGFDSRAISPVGAVGLMQLMPETAASLGVNPYDPGQNVYGGVRYFSQQLQHFGDVALALAAYNAGPEAVERYGGIPPYTETLNYVDRVIGDYQDARGFRRP